VEDAPEFENEPAAWSRWLSSVVKRPAAGATDGDRFARSGVLFDTIRFERVLFEGAAPFMRAWRSPPGPVAAEADTACVLVPHGVHQSWADLELIVGSLAGVASCVPPGTVVRLPPRKSSLATSTTWLIRPVLDADGLPVLTDPLEVLDVIRRAMKSGG
jgi:hypothetical protein